MASLNMIGPFELTTEKVNEVVKETKPGNYGLGFQDEKDWKFGVQLIGRADADLKAELLTQVGKAQYSRFMYSYADTAKTAFEKECWNYHNFGGKKYLANQSHPQKPAGAADCKCPVPGCKE